MKMMTQHMKIYGMHEKVLQEKFMAINIYIKEKKDLKLLFYLNKEMSRTRWFHWWILQSI